MFCIVGVCIYILSRKEYEDWSYGMLIMISMDLLGMLFCVLLLVTLILDSMHTAESTYFSMLVVELFILFFANFMFRGTEGLEEYRIFTEAAYYAVHLMILLTLLTFWVYVKNVVDVQWDRLSALNTVMYVMFFAGVAILLSDFVFGNYYFFDDQGFVEQGEWFYISYVTPILMILLNLAAVIAYISNLRMKILLYFFLAAPLTASIIDIFLLETNILFITMLFAMMGLYVNFYIGRSNDLVLKDAQLTQQRADIMVSQVQPHFLYNALTSIMNIKGNPPETRDAISDFGKYLRGNLDTLKQKGPIAIMLEIEHVKNFMELVKLNGGDDIQLELDIRDPSFLIPSLTLQSVFEALIELGAGYTEPKGTLKITCFATEDAHYVIIGDDSGIIRKCELLAGGDIVEFGLNAVKVRLEEMVKGTIGFRDRDGVTDIEIVIPKGKASGLPE